MAKTAATKTQMEIDVINLKKGETTLWLVGETPFFFNRMAAKAKRELLLPRGRLTATQRATKLKHAPLHEYVDSAYRRPVAAETRLMMVGSSPKKAAAGAALRMPSGVSKTEINALVSVPDEFCPIWGIPRLDMSVVRMAGISRTPDIRTRARLDRWAMRVTYRWVEPMLNETKVATLVLGAGLVCGLGDWRIEKGGPNGGYRIAEKDDKELLDIMKEGGALAQDEALADPVCSNSESEELLAWYLEELERRGLKPEDQQPEDIETDEVETMYFGAGESTLIAPGNGVDQLAVQEGEEYGEERR